MYCFQADNNYLTIHSPVLDARKKKERKKRLVNTRRILQALVYDILPLGEGAGKRCSECALGEAKDHSFSESTGNGVDVVTRRDLARE